MRSPVLPTAAVLAVAAVGLAGCLHGHSPGLTLGYFPNLTHAQALIGIQDGLFAREIGALDVPFATVSFNAGPTAIEALLTDQVDATYVGPAPTLNGLIATGGDVLRVIAGGASGGARFIVQEGTTLDGSNLGGKALATPQLGNTQDISLKAWLASQGHRSKDIGGDVQVINAANPDILTLFKLHQIAGAWVPEPWATRLERDGGGHEQIDERTLWPGGMFATTVLVTTQAYMDAHPDRVAALLRAHAEATKIANAGGPALVTTLNDAIHDATKQRLPESLLASALTKVNFTNDPLPSTLTAFADKARGLGLASGSVPAMHQVVHLDALNAVLVARGESEVPQP